MISISFALSNPWAKPFDNMWNKAGQLTANKSWEVELTSGRELIGFDLPDLRRGLRAASSVAAPPKGH